MTDNAYEYDYSQPITYGAGASVGSTQTPIQLENPFDTDAEACVDFFWSSGTSGNVSVASDTLPATNPNTIQPGISNGATGYVFPVPLLSGFHTEVYLPVKNFLNLIASLSSASFILVVVWRRVRQTYHPVDHKEFNEPTV